MNNFDEAVSGEIAVNVITSELVEFKESSIVRAIETGGELDFLTEQLRKMVEDFEHDMSTGVSRGRSASFARKISKAKVQVVKFAKETIADDKKKIKKVEASLKRVGIDFDELRDKARLPLTEWENEQKIIEIEKAEREAEERLRKEFESDHEMGLLLDDKFDRDAKDKREAEEAAVKLEQEKAAQVAKELAAKQEQERIERDARIAAEAAQKAIDDAKYKAKLEAELVRVDKFNSDHEIALLTNNKMIADVEKIAAEERAKVQAEEAERRRIEAAEKAKRDEENAAECARLSEVRRQEKEAEKLATEQAEREANKKNRLKKHKAAKKDLMEVFGVSDKLSTSIVQGISMGLISDVSIKY